MAYRSKRRSSRSRSASRNSYRPRAASRRRPARRRAAGGGARTIRLQIVQQAPQPQPMAVPGVGMTMPAGPPRRSPF